MDLIYTNSDGIEVGILTDYNLDMAYGIDENDFEITINIENNVLEKNSLIYFENTEYGGIVDSLEVDTTNNVIVFSGRTWHGILNSHIIYPEGDYKIISGNISDAINNLLLGLNFECEYYDLNILDYKFDRYISMYDGINKLLKENNLSMKLIHSEVSILIKLGPRTDYSNVGELDNDLLNFNIKRNFNCINHLVCLGQGDLTDREVVHLYLDEYNSIVNEQYYYNCAEIAKIYENVNSQDLRTDGIKYFEELLNEGSIDVDLFDDDTSFNINDVIAARELITNTYVKKRINKKIIKITNDEFLINYKVGE